MKKLLTVLIVALAAFTALPTLSAEKIIKIGKDAAMTLNKDNVEIYGVKFPNVSETE